MFVANVGAPLPPDLKTFFPPSKYPKFANLYWSFVQIVLSRLFGILACGMTRSTVVRKNVILGPTPRDSHQGAQTYTSGHSILQQSCRRLSEI